MAKSKDGWVTINGVHVLIGANGKITKGPAKFIGSTVDDIKGQKMSDSVKEKLKAKYGGGSGGSSSSRKSKSSGGSSKSSSSEKSPKKESSMKQEIDSSVKNIIKDNDLKVTDEDIRSFVENHKGGNLSDLFDDYYEGKSKFSESDKKVLESYGNLGIKSSREFATGINSMLSNKVKSKVEPSNEGSISELPSVKSFLNSGSQGNRGNFCLTSSVETNDYPSLIKQYGQEKANSMLSKVIEGTYDKTGHSMNNPFTKKDRQEAYSSVTSEYPWQAVSMSIQRWCVEKGACDAIRTSQKGNWKEQGYLDKYEPINKYMGAVLESAISGSKLNTTTLYRGLKLTDSNSEVLKNLKVGDTFNSGGATSSWSSDKKTSSEYATWGKSKTGVVLSLKQGSVKALDLKYDTNNQDESEYLVSKNVNLKVSKIETKGNITYVELEA